MMKRQQLMLLLSDFFINKAICSVSVGVNDGIGRKGIIKIAVSSAKLCVSVLLLVMLLGQHAFAEEYVTEIDVFDDIPVVNAGTRLEQRLTEVPASITIIDREMIGK
jgi:hypothetical protein